MPCSTWPPADRCPGCARQRKPATIRITEEDIARIRAYYELDLNLPIRFSRWLIGQPNGRDYHWQQRILPQPANRLPPDDRGECAERRVVSMKSRLMGCEQNVYLSDLEGRRTSKGVLRGDFGAILALEPRPSGERPDRGAPAQDPRAHGSGAVYLPGDRRAPRDLSRRSSSTPNLITP